MRNKRDDTQFIVDILSDTEKWNAVVLIQVIKGVLIAVIFTFLTCILFEGLWLWISIGLILFFILPIRNALKLIKIKQNYNDFAQLFSGMPEESKIKLYKTVLRSESLNNEQNTKTKSLTKEALKKTLQTLVSDGVLKEDHLENHMNDQSYEFINFLRNHFEKQICHFDRECIEDDDDYKFVMNDILSITQMKPLIKNIISKFDHEREMCNIIFDYNDNKVTWNFKQANDWVSESFLKNLSEFISKNTDGELLIFPAEDQCAEIIYLPKPSAKLLIKHGILLTLS